MADYTKTEKTGSTYTKVDKSKGQGWFKLGWFFDWFQETFFYHKVEKTDSTYTKVDKE
jgi:hypothetical protein